MADFPGAIASFRTMVNRVGVLYDALKTKVIYAEDLNNANAEIVAIETELGVNPKGAYASVAAFLAAIASTLSALWADIRYTLDTGSANTYAIAPTPAISAYAIGQQFLFKAANANSGASTLNVSAKGAISIKKKGDTALASGDIKAGQMVLVAYNEISSSGNVVGSYSEANVNDYYDMYNPSRKGIGQSFTPAANYFLTSAKFYMKKVGTPAGNCYAKLYAHTGTYGTNGTPTGAFLATSSAVVANSLSTSAALITFTFDGTYEMVSGTRYFIVVEYVDGANNSNCILSGGTTSPSHEGNMANWNGSTWTGYSTYDECFYVYGSQLIQRFEMLSQIGN